MRIPFDFQNSSISSSFWRTTTNRSLTCTGRTRNWEDDRWETNEVRGDLNDVFKKAAREYDKWVSSYQKNQRKVARVAGLPPAMAPGGLLDPSPAGNAIPADYNRALYNSPAPMGTYNSPAVYNAGVYSPAPAGMYNSPAVYNTGAYSPASLGTYDAPGAFQSPMMKQEMHPVEYNSALPPPLPPK